MGGFLCESAFLLGTQNHPSFTPRSGRGHLPLKPLLQRDDRLMTKT